MPALWHTPRTALARTTLHSPTIRRVNGILPERYLALRASAPAERKTQAFADASLETVIKNLHALAATRPELDLLGATSSFARELGRNVSTVTQLQEIGYFKEGNELALHVIAADCAPLVKLFLGLYTDLVESLGDLREFQGKNFIAYEAVYVRFVQLRHSLTLAGNHLFHSLLWGEGKKLSAVQDLQTCRDLNLQVQTDQVNMLTPLERDLFLTFVRLSALDFHFTIEEMPCLHNALHYSLGRDCRRLNHWGKMPENLITEEEQEAFRKEQRSQVQKRLGAEIERRVDEDQGLPAIGAISAAIKRNFPEGQENKKFLKGLHQHGLILPTRVALQDFELIYQLTGALLPLYGHQKALLYATKEGIFSKHLFAFGRLLDRKEFEELCKKIEEATGAKAFEVKGIWGDLVKHEGQSIPVFTPKIVFDQEGRQHYSPAFWVFGDTEQDQSHWVEHDREQVRALFLNPYQGYRAFTGSQGALSRAEAVSKFSDMALQVRVDQGIFQRLGRLAQTLKPAIAFPFSIIFEELCDRLGLFAIPESGPGSFMEEILNLAHEENPNSKRRALELYLPIARRCMFGAFAVERVGDHLEVIPERLEKLIKIVDRAFLIVADHAQHKSISEPYRSSKEGSGEENHLSLMEWSRKRHELLEQQGINHFQDLHEEMGRTLTRFSEYKGNSFIFRNPIRFFEFYLLEQRMDLLFEVCEEVLGKRENDQPHEGGVYSDWMAFFECTPLEQSVRLHPEQAEVQFRKNFREMSGRFEEPVTEARFRPDYGTDYETEVQDVTVGDAVRFSLMDYGLAKGWLSKNPGSQSLQPTPLGMRIAGQQTPISEAQVYRQEMAAKGIELAPGFFRAWENPEHAWREGKELSEVRDALDPRAQSGILVFSTTGERVKLSPYLELDLDRTQVNAQEFALVFDQGTAYLLPLSDLGKEVQVCTISQCLLDPFLLSYLRGECLAPTPKAAPWKARLRSPAVGGLILEPGNDEPGEQKALQSLQARVQVAFGSFPFPRLFRLNLNRQTNAPLALLQGDNVSLDSNAILPLCAAAQEASVEARVLTALLAALPLESGEILTKPSSVMIGEHSTRIALAQPQSLARAVRFNMAHPAHDPAFCMTLLETGCEIFPPELRHPLRTLIREVKERETRRKTIARIEMNMAREVAQEQARLADKAKIGKLSEAEKACARLLANKVTAGAVKTAVERTFSESPGLYHSANAQNKPHTPKELFDQQVPRMKGVFARRGSDTFAGTFRIPTQSGNQEASEEVLTLYYNGVVRRFGSSSGILLADQLIHRSVDLQTLEHEWGVTLADLIPIPSLEVAAIDQRLQKVREMFRRLRSFLNPRDAFSPQLAGPLHGAILETWISYCYPHWDRFLNLPKDESKHAAPWDENALEASFERFLRQYLDTLVAKNSPSEAVVDYLENVAIPLLRSPQAQQQRQACQTIELWEKHVFDRLQEINDAMLNEVERISNGGFVEVQESAEEQFSGVQRDYLPVLFGYFARALVPERLPKGRSFPYVETVSATDVAPLQPATPFAVEPVLDTSVTERFHQGALLLADFGSEVISDLETALTDFANSDNRDAVRRHTLRALLNGITAHMDLLARGAKNQHAFSLVKHLPSHEPALSAGEEHFSYFAEVHGRRQAVNLLLRPFRYWSREGIWLPRCLRMNIYFTSDLEAYQRARAFESAGVKQQDASFRFEEPAHRNRPFHFNIEGSVTTQTGSRRHLNPHFDLPLSHTEQYSTRMLAFMDRVLEPLRAWSR